MRSTSRKLSTWSLPIIWLVVSLDGPPDADVEKAWDAGLNRSASTLSRKLRRNGWVRPKGCHGPGHPRGNARAVRFLTTQAVGHRLGVETPTALTRRFANKKWICRLCLFGMGQTPVSPPAEPGSYLH